MGHTGVSIVRRKRDCRTKMDYIRQRKARLCADCGVQYPYWIMQFDHVKPATKLYSAGDLSQRSWTTIDAELEKCEVVCGNCHLNRTYLLKHYLSRRQQDDELAGGLQYDFFKDI